MASWGSGLASCGGEPNGEMAGGEGESGGETDGDEFPPFMSLGGGVGGPGTGDDEPGASSSTGGCSFFTTSLFSSLTLIIVDVADADAALALLRLTMTIGVS